MRRDALLFLSLCVALLLSCAAKPRSDLSLAREYFAAERWREAIAAFERDLIRHPENFESQAIVGLSYEKLGEHDAALEAYRKTFVLNPVNAAAFCGTARVLAARSQWEESWRNLLQARGAEANETLLALYPAFRAAHEAGSFTPPPASLTVAGEKERTVTVAVSVTQATIKTRERIAVAAVAPWARDPFGTAYLSALAGSAADRIARCHDRFFARHLPAGLEATYDLTVNDDGTVVPPEGGYPAEPDEMRACVAAAFTEVRFTAPAAR